MYVSFNKNEKGAILITSIWVLLILAVVAAGFAHRLSIELRLVELRLESLRSYYAAKAGIKKAIYEIWKDNNLDYDSLNERWCNNPLSFKDQELEDGVFTVSMSYGSGVDVIRFYGASDEERKININRASEGILKRIFKENPEVVANILDWRDEDNDAHPGGAENLYYQTLRNPYQCKNGHFTILEELQLVKGVTPEILLKVNNLITTYGNGKVNINTCDVNVLNCLGLSESAAQKIVSLRKGSDGIEGTLDDNVFVEVEKIKMKLANFAQFTKEELIQIDSLINEQLFSVNSRFFQINSVGTTKGKKVEKEITAIVKRQKQGLPRIVHWYES